MNQQLTTVSNKGSALALSPKTEKAIAALDPEQKRLVEAGLGVAIRKLSEEITLDSLVEIIGSIYILAGQSADPLTLPTYATAFYHRLMQEYPLVTIEEIRIALNNGVYEQYGAYYGLNAKTFVIWIRAYLEDEKRKAAIEAFAKNKKLKEEVPPSPPYWTNDYWTEENVSLWRKEAEKSYQYFLSGHAMVAATPEGVYWLLRRENKIEISAEKVDQLINQARNIIRNNSIVNSSRRSSLELEKFIEKLTNGNDKQTRTLLQLEAKRIAVIEYFSKAQKEGLPKLF